MSRPEPEAFVSGGMDPEVMKYFQQMMGQLGAMGPEQRYTGQLTAGMTPLQLQALQTAGAPGMAGTAGFMGAGQTLLGETLGGRFMDVAQTPYVQDITSAMTRQIQELMGGGQDVLAGQAQRAGIGGASPYMTQSRLLQERGMGQLGEQLSGLYGGIYQAERGRQQQALGMVPGMAMLPFQQAQAQFGLGEAARGIGQAGLTAQYQDWLRTQGPSGAQRLQASMIGGAPAQQTQWMQQKPWWETGMEVGKGVADIWKTFS